MFFKTSSVNLLAGPKSLTYCVSRMITIVVLTEGVFNEVLGDVMKDLRD